MNESYRDPVALQLLDGWATRWPAWLAWMGLASPLCGGLLYVFIWLVLWLKSGSNQPPQADSKVALRRLDAAEQLRRVANGLIVLGVAMLVLWIPLTFAAVVTIPLSSIAQEIL